MDEAENDSDRANASPDPDALSPAVATELSLFNQDTQRPNANRLTSGAALARVLVVEDDADMRAYVLECLADAFDVVGAPSLERALSISQWMIPDVVICDLILPGRSGMEIRQVFAVDPSLRTVPILYVSGEVERPSSATHFLSKPFTRATLRAAVLHALHPGA